MTAPIPDLDAIRARADAATPGPWDWQTVHPYMDGRVQGRIAPLGKPKVLADVMAFADMVFIAHARSDVPALVAEVERLRDLAEKARVWREARRAFPPQTKSAAALIAAVDDLAGVPDDPT